MSNRHSNQQSLQQQWEQRWHAIEEAGGRYQYIQQQLRKQGFLLERRPIDQMSKKERERYKKTLKQEAQAKRQIQKDTWQAYKAKHIVHLGQGIYWSDDTSTDKWDLADAQKRLVENQLPVFKNPQQLAKQLNLTISQLKGLCYQREVATYLPYHHFTIAKRNGSARQIWAPIPLLKNVQRWILDNILNNLMIHGSAHGFIRDKSIASNANIHTNSQLIIKLDIQDFFPSISQKRVKGVFRHAGYQEQIATLLALLCTEAPREIIKHQNTTYYVALAERCLPQGAPTSPALTNIICLNLDRRLTGLADKLGLRYSRYADDLTFSLPANTDISHEAEKTLISQLLGSVAKVLSEEGFAIHRKKTKIIRHGNSQQVTGLIVNGDGSPRVPRHIKRMLRSAVFNLEQGKALPEGESIARLKGFASFIAMTEPKLGKAFIQRLTAIEKSQQ